MTNLVASLYRQIELENAARRESCFPLMVRRIDTPLPDRVDQHPAGLYLIGRRSSLSRSAGFSVLNTVARLLGQEDIQSTPWHLIRDYEMHLLRSALAERYAPATANKMLSIVRSVLGQAWKLGMMDTDAYQRAVAVPSIPGTRLPAGRTLEPAQIRALFEACGEAGPQAARDAALLAILLGCGLRRTEAARLDIEHLDRTEATLRVIGKGNHERVAPMSAGVRTALDAWLTARGDAPGPLLCAMTGKGNRITRRRLHTESIRLIVKRRAGQAGIRFCTPHDLRRTFITSLLDQSNGARSARS